MLRPVGLALRARPLLQRWLRGIFLDVASTPPISGGELARFQIHPTLKRVKVAIYGMRHYRRRGSLSQTKVKGTNRVAIPAMTATAVKPAASKAEAENV